ncbi:FecR family protein [Pedobacter sp. ok626]|uniref:FecR family protein n=1 Tax=Pedobacter sp. ok626 TaxID=1761882 RepID=UPI0008908D92|nr:FecR family protein [Pedobacter sp. ok626]SDK59363.1 FecR family protein [Pedobacter sp. ok626]
MEPNRIIFLYHKIKQKTASEDEQQEFDQLLQDEDAEQELKMHWDQLWTDTMAEDKSALQIRNEQEILQDILSHKGGMRTIQLNKKTVGYKYLVAAACILIVMGSALFFFNHKTSVSSNQPTVAHAIAPGKNRATLTLANGKKIVLSDVANGELAKEAGVKISKSADGQIVYEIIGTANNSNQLNTLSTSNGETYRIRLPDQSEVWLNAASTIKYPVSFAKHATRKIELTGEAYFEISRDKKHPFIVESKGQRIEVLGTHFNVNAYANENNVKTTLIEGCVKVQIFNSDRKALGGEQAILKPGEQSLLSADGLNVRQADVEEAIAWKMGFFKFRDENIQSIMRKVSRWYDVEVIYKGEIPQSGLEGTVSRYQDITQLLDMLQSTGLVKFSIIKNKIIVSK